jgi:glycosyltransferase involved in cell wall biosynthesis
MKKESTIISNWKTSQILCSVACTTYNHENFIEDAITGFLMQETDFPFEVIIHDDASTDRTPEILRKYWQLYPTIIRPVLQEENQRAKGIKNSPVVYSLCKGKYIARCEGDDYWTDPLKLQKQVDFLEKNEDFSLCFSRVGICKKDKIDPDEHKNYYRKIMKDRTDFTVDDILRINFIGTCSVVFRKTNVQNYPDWTKKVPFGDWPQHFLNATHGKIRYIDELMAVYRVHSGGVWSKTKQAVKMRGLLSFYYLVSKHYNNKYDAIIIQSCTGWRPDLSNPVARGAARLAIRMSQTWVCRMFIQIGFLRSILINTAQKMINRSTSYSDTKQ